MSLCHFRIEKDHVYFKGTGGVEKKQYEVKISLYKEIDPEKSTSSNRGRCIELVLTKEKADEPYWPALTNDKKKHHWVKSDFNKWRDEDDSEDDLGKGGGDNFEEMLRQMGGLGGAGAGKPSLDDLDVGGETDSDDDAIPDLE